MSRTPRNDIQVQEKKADEKTVHAAKKRKLGEAFQDWGPYGMGVGEGRGAKFAKWGLSKARFDRYGDICYGKPLPRGTTSEGKLNRKLHRSTHTHAHTYIFGSEGNLRMCNDSVTQIRRKWSGRPKPRMSNGRFTIGNPRRRKLTLDIRNT